jgi:nicotinate-nucleotide adenylyltransferase
MRTAIFGGTFNPVHSAHLAMARAAADQCALDRVLFIPAGNPPHKETNTPYEHRFRMVELACEADPRFVASRLEEGAAKSYSIHTIEKLKALEPSAELFFLIGSDAFEELQTWFRWQDVVRAVEFIVVARPGHAIAAIPGARVHRLEMPESAVSSSQIRGACATGNAHRELPANVADYIGKHELYR